MCFPKKLFLLFLVNHERLLVVLACLKNLFQAVHFYSYFSDIFQGFYLDLKLYYFDYILDFPRARIFQNSFSLPLHGDCLGITQLTWLKTVVLLIHFTYSGCLRFPESSTIVCSRLGPRNLRYFSYWLVFQVAFK